MIEQGLTGVRVGLTRPTGMNGRLENELIALGAHVDVVPLLSIEVLPEGVDALVAAMNLHPDWWMAATSANATVAIAEAVTRFGGPQPQLGAIGPATAAAAEFHGLVVHVQASVTTAVGLADALIVRQPPGVVLSQALHPLPDLERELRAAGIPVIGVPTYATVPAMLDQDRLETLLRTDLVVVASPSAVQHLVEVAGRDRVPPLVSIGATTSAAAEAAGCNVLATAVRPGLHELVAACSVAALKL